MATHLDSVYRQYLEEMGGCGGTGGVGTNVEAHRLNCVCAEQLDVVVGKREKKNTASNSTEKMRLHA